MLGNAQIFEGFDISKIGRVVGYRVMDETIERRAYSRRCRSALSKLATLTRLKEEVKDAQVEQECGVAFENYQDMRAGCNRIEEIERTL